MAAGAKCALCKRRTTAPVSLFNGRLVLCPRDVPDPLPDVGDPDLLLVVLALGKLGLLTPDQMALLAALAATPPDRRAVKTYAAEVEKLRRAGLVESTGPACRLTGLGRRLLDALQPPAAP